jgi:hypothetical protein
VAYQNIYGSDPPKNLGKVTIKIHGYERFSGGTSASSWDNLERILGE